jgi:hypothetical protein
MADNYKVKVQVEIEKCADAVTDEFTRIGDGLFEYIISAEEGQSIDVCEQICTLTN